MSSIVIPVSSDPPSWNLLPFLMHCPHLSEHVRGIALYLLWPHFLQSQTWHVHKIISLLFVHQFHTPLCSCHSSQFTSALHLVLLQTPCLTAMQHCRSHKCQIDPFIFRENKFAAHTNWSTNNFNILNPVFLAMDTWTGL